jgi:hypothetical protein
MTKPLLTLPLLPSNISLTSSKIPSSISLQKKTEKLKAAAAPTKDLVPDSDKTIPDLTGGISCSNGELHLRVVQRLWTSMMTIFPQATLAATAEKLLTCLIIAEEVVLPSNAKLYGVVSANVSVDADAGEQVRNAWVKLCVDLLRVCDGDVMQTFWECEEDGMQLGA